MDPALSISSPFRNEAKATEGVLDTAIERITAETHPDEEESQSVPFIDEQPQFSTTCALCSNGGTNARVPRDGLYICSECVAARRANPRKSNFPAGTFRCCPMSTTEDDSGVLCCASCHRWHHASCVGVTNTLLRDQASLSTTKWYCPEPECSESVILRQLKKAR